MFEDKLPGAKHVDVFSFPVYKQKLPPYSGPSLQLSEEESRIPKGVTIQAKYAFSTTMEFQCYYVITTIEGGAEKTISVNKEMAQGTICESLINYYENLCHNLQMGRAEDQRYELNRFMVLHDGPLLPMLPATQVDSRQSYQDLSSVAGTKRGFEAPGSSERMKLRRALNIGWTLPIANR